MTEHKYRICMSINSGDVFCIQNKEGTDTFTEEKAVESIKFLTIGVKSLWVYARRLVDEDKPENYCIYGLSKYYLQQNSILFWAERIKENV